MLRERAEHSLIFHRNQAYRAARRPDFARAFSILPRIPVLLSPRELPRVRAIISPHSCTAQANSESGIVMEEFEESEDDEDPNKPGPVEAYAFRACGKACGTCE